MAASPSTPERVASAEEWSGEEEEEGRCRGRRSTLSCCPPRRLPSFQLSRLAVGLGSGGGLGVVSEADAVGRDGQTGGAELADLAEGDFAEEGAVAATEGEGDAVAVLPL